MNSYERIKTAMLFKEPDRVPFAEFYIDRSVWQAIMPDAKEQHDFEDYYDLDVVNVKNFYESETLENGDVRDEWGIRYFNASPLPKEGPIEDESQLAAYQAPDGSLPKRLGRLHEIVERYKGKKFISFQCRAFFLWATALCGFENLLVYMKTDPELVAALFDNIVEQQIKLVRNAIRAGADMILETDDYAFNSGSFVSPEMFRNLLVPRIKRFCDAVHEEGCIVISHSDGNLMGILDDLVVAGVDGINSIDPIAGMDLALVKKKYGQKISLWGNFDCGNLLTYGTEDEIENAIKNCIRDGAPGGGFVLCSCNTIPPSAKPENYAAIIKYARKYGDYPVTL